MINTLSSSRRVTATDSSRPASVIASAPHFSISLSAAACTQALGTTLATRSPSAIGLMLDMDNPPSGGPNDPPPRRSWSGGERLRSVLFPAAGRAALIWVKDIMTRPRRATTRCHRQAFILFGDHQQLSAYHRIRCVASSRSDEVGPRSVLISGEALAVGFDIGHGPHWLEKGLNHALNGVMPIAEPVRRCEISEFPAV
jgi:hypothetical protein